MARSASSTRRDTSARSRSASAAGDHAARQVAVDLGQLVAVDREVIGRRRRRRLPRRAAAARRAATPPPPRPIARRHDPECHAATALPSRSCAPCNRCAAPAKGANPRAAACRLCRSAMSHFSRLCRLSAAAMTRHRSRSKTTGSPATGDASPMKRYSVFAIAREALRNHRAGNAPGPRPQPKAAYDAIIVGRRGPRPCHRLLPWQEPRHHQCRDHRKGLARRRQHRAQHHDHPLELPAGPLGRDLRKGALAL